ncbi:polysaccharide deacetylase family protein [Nonomuraea wenchangensis]
MLYGGIAWNGNGYNVRVVDEPDGREVAAEDFPASGRSDLVDYVAALQDGRDERLCLVIDSSNGMLDGTLMAAGLDVYRADPWQLPAPPQFGSPAAGELAEIARMNLSELARLEIETGTLTGRLTELQKGIQETWPTEMAMIGAGHCLAHGSRREKRLALTFDDGPHPLFTDRVLKVLRRYEVPATFFCVGLHAAGHPEVVRRILDGGHALGNHTWSHPYLPDLTKDGLAEQVARTARQLPAGGGAPALFRPPYGSRSPDILSWLVELGTTTVLWDVEPFDWALPGAGVIADRVLADVRPGSVILLHDGGGDRSQTVAALPSIIERLLDDGYEFVTVDQLATR